MISRFGRVWNVSSERSGGMSRLLLRLRSFWLIDQSARYQQAQMEDLCRRYGSLTPRRRQAGVRGSVKLRNSSAALLGYLTRIDLPNSSAFASIGGFSRWFWFLLRRAMQSAVSTWVYTIYEGILDPCRIVVIFLCGPPTHFDC